MKLLSTKSKTTVTKVETYVLEPVRKFSPMVVKTYLNSKLSSVKLEIKFKHEHTYAEIVKKSFFDYIKTNSPFASGSIADHVENQKTADIEKAYKENRIVLFYTSGHVLFDMNGDPIPFVHHFDYIGTDFQNSRVDLDKVIKTLSKHKWVINRKELKIVEAPYYNSDFTGHKFVGVDLLPDKETYKKMYNMALNKKTEYFSTELKELMIGRSYVYPKFDPLGIHKLHLSEQEQVKLRSCHCSEESDY